LAFVVLSSFVLIGPISLLVGFSFSFLSKAGIERQGTHPNIFAKFFAYEALGFFIGGLSFSFLFSSYSNPLIFTPLALIFFLAYKGNLKNKIFLALVILLLSLLLFANFNQILKKELSQANISFNQSSVYGPVIKAEKFGIDSIYANGDLISTSEDKLSVEEFIHISLSAHKKPKNILFIGPALSGQIDEILKYDIATVDCVEINPVLSSLSKLATKDSKKVNFIVNDPRLYIKNTEKKYDFILMNMSAPSNLAYNRYFTFKFFKSLKGHLAREGVFSFFIPSKRDILSPKFLQFNSCIVNTVRRVFKNTLLIPSDSMIIIASNEKITGDKLLSNFSEDSPKTDYFTFYHFKDYLDAGRIKYIEDSIDKSISINYDFYPMGFLYFSLLEQAKFYPNIALNVGQTKYVGLTIFFGFVLMTALLSFKRKKLAILSIISSIGFVSFAVTSIIFLSFQIYSGGLFWKMGILVGLFMLGLSSGTLLINFLSDKILFKRFSLFIFYFSWIVYIVSLFFAISNINKIYFSDYIFYIFSLLSGILTGAVYPIGSRQLTKVKIKLSAIPSLVYSADLLGAFLGTFFFSCFFIPFLGIFYSLGVLLVFLLIFCLFSFTIPQQ